MITYIRHDFETAFQDRLFRFPYNEIGDKRGFTVLNPFDTVLPKQIAIVQCESVKMAEKLRKAYDIGPFHRVRQFDFHQFFEKADFSHIDIGPAINLYPLSRPDLPRWGELKQWMADSLEGGEVSVYMSAKVKRLSFSNPSDYFLFNLAWS